jgi:hypothetical protein
MDQRQFEATLSDAEIRLRRLRTLYDQWFHGLERTEPQVQRAEVDRIITDLRRAQPRNTALRFRFNQLVQRYTSYNTYWQRITRQIEEGTYKRDVLRARKRFGERDVTKDKRAKDGYELELDIDIEAALDSVMKSDPPPAPSEAPPPVRTSRPPPNSSRPPRALREITPFALPGDPGLPQVPHTNGHGAAPSLPAAAAKLAAASNPNGAANGKSAAKADAHAKPASPAKISVPAVHVTPKAGLPPAVNATPKVGAPVAGPPSVPLASRRPPPVPPGASRRPPPANAAPGRAPAAGAATAVSAAAASGNGALSDEQIQGIYARYVEARKQNKERVDNVKIETVAKTVRDMLPKLEQKHAGKKIDFEVVVKDGRVALKPVAK